ncbi:hypothetical protein V1264_011861 [Littorina saxatilis]|uniref:Uncharacterized protein n=2 Tax=Littorina saxatilis TaxID=31220 RepID=A0AAN9GLJ2_9CAEN
MRELWTSEYCWSQISNIYPVEGYNVYGTLLGEEFDVNDCFIGQAEVDSVGIARIQLPSITQVYLDSIASGFGCRSAACVPEESWRHRVALTGDCFIISYGTATEQAPPITFDGIAKRIDVRGDYRKSECATVEGGDAYTPNEADKICYISATDGANCGTGDSSSPVFCYTDTMEPVLSAFTVPNQDCDPNQLTFPSDIV